MQESGGVSKASEILRSFTPSAITRKVDRFQKSFQNAIEDLNEEKEDFQNSIEQRKQRVLDKASLFFSSSAKLNKARESYRQAKQEASQKLDNASQAIDEKTEALKDTIASKLKLSENSKIRKKYNEAIQTTKEMKEDLAIELKMRREDLKEQIADLRNSIKKLNLRGKIKLPKKLEKTPLAKVFQTREEKLYHASDKKKADYYRQQILKGLEEITFLETETARSKEVENRLFDHLLAFASLQMKTDEPELKDLIMTQQREIEENLKYRMARERLVDYLENKVAELIDQEPPEEGLNDQLNGAGFLLSRLMRESTDETEERIQDLMDKIINKQGI